MRSKSMEWLLYDNGLRHERIKKYDLIETRLYNIFKRKNATKLTKPIIASLYKVLLDKILFVTIKRPVYILWAFELLTAFNL